MKCKNCLFLWILVVSFGMMSARQSFCEEVLLYDAHGKRDPFTPLVSGSSRQGSGLLGVENVDDLNLEGVVYDPQGGSVAIINGSLLKEGEESGTVKVISVQPEGARISVSGMEVYKTVYKMDTSTSASRVDKSPDE